MIDLCIALNGPLVDVLLPIMMHTLQRHCDLSDVHVHFIDKDCTPQVLEYICGLSLPFAITVHQMPEPPDHVRMRWHTPDPENPEPDPAIIRDVAWTCQWMLDNCGHHEWAFIAHFDIEFRADLLGYFRSMIADGVGQIGSHATGMVGYRRKAVASSDVGFHVMDDCYAVKEDGRWKLRRANDSRCTDKSFPIHGWDVGELLEIGLCYKNWRIISPPELELQKWRIHNGSGCGRCEGANQMIRDRAVLKMKELGLAQIV